MCQNVDLLYQRLYQLGARKMLFHGLGPLGCIPSQRVKSKTGQCLKRVNQLVLEFNSKVKNLVASLNGRLPNAKLIFADTYSGILDLIDNPSAYGKPKTAPFLAMKHANCLRMFNSFFFCRF